MPYPPPKRILALDGGGVRGLISLAFLEELERILADRAGSGDGFRLCDHFDLVGGTSTGALIATGIALGYRVQELIDLYLRLSHRAFQGHRWHGGLLTPKFDSGALLAEIKRQVGDETLGSDRLRTGLAVVAKRIDTGSPWVFHNNPRARFYNVPEDDPNAFPNKDIPLHAILRASTAAPTYYEPESIRIHQELDGLFVDGGVSPFNNPALLLFQMVTTDAYGYSWPTGKDRLHLLSIGTGSSGGTPFGKDPGRMMSGELAVYALRSVMEDCSWQAQAILQWLGHCPRPWNIDSEMGTLADESLTPEPLLTYLRYDVLMERGWLEAELGWTAGQAEIESLSSMDRPDKSEALRELGRRAAKRQVRVEEC